MKIQPAAEVALAVEQFAGDGFASFWTPRTGAAADAIRKELARREASGEELWLPPTEFSKMCGCESRPYAGDAWKDFPQLEEVFAGDIGDFLTAHYGTGFKILWGTLYRSKRQEVRSGPQVWHCDYFPGTCVVVIFYLHDTAPEDGPVEVITWDRSLALHEQELRSGSDRRHLVADRDRESVVERGYRLGNWYTERIEAGEGGPVQQLLGPAGLVVPFLNSTLHRGGYPAAGRTRMAIRFYCYPSHQPTNLERYRYTGMSRDFSSKDPNLPYPRDPAAEF